MRRTGTAGRGRRFAALLAVTVVALGASAGTASGVESIRAQQWHLEAMHAPEMWRTSTGSGVTVAVIDTGVQGDTADLQGRLLPGTDLSGLTKSGGVLHDMVGHGTGMATLIAGTGKGAGGKGAFGLAPDARILPVKVNAGSDFTAADTEYADQLAEGITYAADHGAKVINLSQGVRQNLVTPAQLAKFRTAVEHADAKGSLIVASVGNAGDKDNPVEYPGGLPGVVGVAATDRTGKVAPWSEHGPQVLLAAPGVDIYSACTGKTGYCKTQGTSDASALVSASAALLWSAHPDWTNNQVLRVLINTASNPKERSDYIGYGAVRPRIALTTPGDPGPADVSPLAGAAAPAPAPEQSGAAASTAGSAPAGSAPSQAPASQPAAAAEKSSGSGGMLLVVGGIAAVVVVLVIVVVVVRRNRPAAAGPVPPAPYGGQPQPSAQPYPVAGYPAGGHPAAGYPTQPPAGPYGGQPQPYGQAPQQPYGQPPQSYGQQPPSGGNPYPG